MPTLKNMTAMCHDLCHPCLAVLLVYIYFSICLIYYLQVPTQQTMLKQHHTNIIPTPMQLQHDVAVVLMSYVTSTLMQHNAETSYQHY